MAMNDNSVYNVLMQRGNTALMIAATNGDEEIFDLLLEHDADIMKKTSVSCFF